MGPTDPRAGGLGESQQFAAEVWEKREAGALGLGQPG